MKNWSRTHFREANLASASEFNAEYQARVEPLATGLDRSNLPESCIDRVQVQPNALHSITLEEDIFMLGTYQTSNGGAGDFKCLEYDVYSGGWVTNNEWTLTGFSEGMLQVEFSCWQWVYAMYTKDNPKGVSWRLLFNGSVLAESAPIMTAFACPRLCYTGPLKSSGTLTLQWRYTSPDGAVDVDTANQVYFAGGQVLIIARWR